VLETFISLLVSPIRVSTQVTSCVLGVQVLFTMGQTDAVISVVPRCTNISHSAVCKLYILHVIFGFSMYTIFLL